jgi:hypothetical protein
MTLIASLLEQAARVEPDPKLNSPTYVEYRQKHPL